MEDRIDAVEHRRVEAADVALDQLDLVAHPGEPAVAEEELVEHADRFAPSSSCRTRTQPM